MGQGYICLKLDSGVFRNKGQSLLTNTKNKIFTLMKIEGSFKNIKWAKKITQEAWLHEFDP